MNSPEARTPAVKPAGEPSCGTVPIPRWFYGLVVLLVGWSGYQLFERAGNFDARVYVPYRSTNELATLLPKPSDQWLASGRKVFELTCAPCHQTSGLGELGKAPPLAGSEWVTSPGPNRLIRLVLDGLQGPVQVKGQDWSLAMPAWRETLTDAQIAAVLSYLRTSWGHQSSLVAPAQVNALRQSTQGRADHYTAPELQRHPESD